MTDLEFKRLGDWASLKDFQMQVAKSWLGRGKGSRDVFACFFFYFSGLNALYFLWSKIDEINGRREGEHISNLLKRISESESAALLNEAEFVRLHHYLKRRGPIADMRQRTPSDLEGEFSDGTKLLASVDGGGASSERLDSLAQIIYQVRCNLVHGSKRDHGNDEELVGSCLVPLKRLLEQAIALTESAYKAFYERAAGRP